MNARTDTDRAPFWAKHVTLGRVALGGVITYAQSKGDKVAMLETAEHDFATGDATYLLAWTGQWSTDLFKVTADDVQRWLGEHTHDRAIQSKARR